jgi:hypothetical protein
VDNPALPDILLVEKDEPTSPDISAVSSFLVSSEWPATAPASNITTTNTAVFQVFPPLDDGEQQSTPQPGTDESQQDSACFSFVSISFSPDYRFFIFSSKMILST